MVLQWLLEDEKKGEKEQSPPQISPSVAPVCFPRDSLTVIREKNNQGESLCIFFSPCLLHRANLRKRRGQNEKVRDCVVLIRLPSF